MDRKGKLFIIWGPSGVGKTTLINELLTTFDVTMLSRVITYTSRPARVNDVAGIDYHFITPDDFAQKIEEGFFIEWSDVYGHYYGSAWQSIKDLDNGTSYILILDRLGTKRILSQLSATTIAILPPSLDILEDRLIKRGSESLEGRVRRLALAKEELEAEKAEGIYKHHVVNAFFDETVKKLAKIIACEIHNAPLF